jgi:hypothetical protein
MISFTDIETAARKLLDLDWESDEVAHGSETRNRIVFTQGYSTDDLIGEDIIRYLALLSPESVIALLALARHGSTMDELANPNASGTSSDITTTHWVSPSVAGEKCACGRPATHKIAEEIKVHDPARPQPSAYTTNNAAANVYDQEPKDFYRTRTRQALTAFVCCDDFARVMGPIAAEHCFAALA